MEAAVLKKAAGGVVVAPLWGEPAATAARAASRGEADQPIAPDE